MKIGSDTSDDSGEDEEESESAAPQSTDPDQPVGMRKMEPSTDSGSRPR